MVLRWTTFVLGLLMAGVVTDVCAAKTIATACERTTKVELASTGARGSRLASGIEAPRHGTRDLAHEHPPAVPTSFLVAAPFMRVAIVTSSAPARGIDASTAPDVVARGPPASVVRLFA